MKQPRSSFEQLQAGDVHRRVLDLPSRSSLAIPVADLLHNGILEIFPQVEERGYFSLHFRGKELLLTAGPYIGLIPICPGITINVQPRLPVSNLARVIELSQKRLGLLEGVTRSYSWDGQATPSVLEFLTIGLLAALRPINIHGMERQYEQTSVATSHPRGRIELRSTLASLIARGISHKVVSRRFSQTTDTIANRLIKAALCESVRKLSRSAATPSVMRELNRALLVFDGVPLDIPGSLSAAHNVMQFGTISVRRYYGDALRLASTILSNRGLSLDVRDSEFELSSFILNFENVFEDYVREVLKRGLHRGEPGMFAVLDGNTSSGMTSLFDDRPSPTAQPDIVVLRKNQCVAVAEVKYKEATNRDNLNQLIAYSARYRAPSAVLIHLASKGHATSLQRLGKMRDTEFFKVGFDLSSFTLESEEEMLVSAVESMTTA